MTTWLLAVLLAQAPGGEAVQEWLHTVADVVGPESILPGETAVRRLVFETPDGASVEPATEWEPGPAIERAGEITVRRELRASGRVRWTVSARVTGWTPGSAPVAGIPVAVSYRGLREVVATDPAWIVVADALPGGGDPPPAPPEGPMDGDGLPWGWLPFAPLALAGLTGAGWWRAGRPMETDGGGPAPLTAFVPPGADPGEEFARGFALLDTDARAAVSIMASAVRHFPETRGVRVRSSTTTGELTRLLVGLEDRLPVTEIVSICEAGDAWRFGRRAPDAESLRTLGGTIQGAWIDA